MQYVLGNMLNGGGINPDGLSLDLQFAADKTFSKPSSLAAGETAITSRRGPSATFLRSSGATEVGPDGLIRYAPENLFTKSEEFNDAAWTKAAVSVTSNATTAPNGALTADAIIENAANTIHRVGQIITSLAGVPYSYSVYAKNNGRRYLYMNAGVPLAAAATFDLQDGTFIIASGAASITNVGDGWYRCTVTGASVAGASGSGFLQLNNSSAATDSTYLGDGVSGIFLWGAQVERHPTVRAYIPTTTAAVYGPRFDHDPVTGVCRGLLIEEGRTNALQHSANFKNTTSSSYWENISATTVTVDQTTSPDGGVNADLLTTSATAYDCFTRRNNIYVGSTQYSYSIFVKRGPSNYRYVGFYLGAGASSTQFPYFDFDNPTTVQVPTITSGTINSTGVDAYPNGWYRIRITFTTAVTPIDNFAGVYISSSNGTLQLANPAGNDCYIWGIQLELGSFPTSYIPTTTGTLARSADVCSITTAGWSNAGNDTMVAEYFVRNFLSGSIVLEGGPLLSWMSVSFSGVNQQRNLYRHGGASNRVDATSDANSVSLTSINKTALTSGEQIALNGSLSQTLFGDPTQSDISTILNIGRRSDFGGANYLNGHIAAIRYYKKRLPNAKIQALTV